MEVREKLVELLKTNACLSPFMCDPSCRYYGFGDCFPYRFADHLISNGVTVQEWISVKDRLPTIYDADEDNCVLAIHKASNKRYYHWRSVANNPFDFTHWMKTPQPPKGE